MKAHIYRVGDKVRILRPRFVRRVGYPLVWHEVKDVQLYADPRIGSALRALGLHPASLEGLARGHDEIPRHLQIAFAKEFVAQNNFGGKERSIYYHPDGDPGWQMPLNWTCGPAKVVGKRVVKTGTYYHGRIDRDGDGEPGGLNDCKTHVLLCLGMGYEIEARNVEHWT